MINILITLFFLPVFGQVPELFYNDLTCTHFQEAPSCGSPSIIFNATYELDESACGDVCRSFFAHTNLSLSDVSITVVRENQGQQCCFRDGECLLTSTSDTNVTANINASIVGPKIMKCGSYYELEGCAKHDRKQFNAWRAVCSKESTQFLCNHVDSPEDIFQGCIYVFFLIITLDLLTAFFLFANRMAFPKGYCSRIIGTNFCFLCCRMFLGYRSTHMNRRFQETQEKRMDHLTKLKKKKYIEIVQKQLESTFTPDIATDVWNFLFVGGNYNDTNHLINAKDDIEIWQVGERFVTYDNYAKTIEPGTQVSIVRKSPKSGAWLIDSDSFQQYFWVGKKDLDKLFLVNALPIEPISDFWIFRTDLYNFVPYHWSLNAEERCRTGLIFFLYITSQFAFVLLAVLLFIKFCTLLDPTFSNSGSDCRTIVLPYYISNTSFVQVLSLAMFFTIDIVVIGILQCGFCASFSIGNLVCGCKWCCVSGYGYTCCMHNFFCWGWTFVLLLAFALPMGLYSILIAMAYILMIIICLTFILYPAYLILMQCVVPCSCASYEMPRSCCTHVIGEGPRALHTDSNIDDDKNKERVLVAFGTLLGQGLLFLMMVVTIFYGLHTAAFAASGETQYLWQRTYGPPAQPECEIWKSCECARSTQKTTDTDYFYQESEIYFTCEEWSNCKYCFGKCEDKSTCDVFNSRWSECINENQCLWNGNTDATYSQKRCATCKYSTEIANPHSWHGGIPVETHHEAWWRTYVEYIYGIHHEADVFFSFPFTTLPEDAIEFLSSPADALQNILSDLKTAFKNGGDMGSWIRGMIFARFICMLMLKYGWITFGVDSMGSLALDANLESYKDPAASHWDTGKYLGRYGVNRGQQNESKCCPLRSINYAGYTAECSVELQSEV